MRDIQRHTRNSICARKAIRAPGTRLGKGLLEKFKTISMFRECPCSHPSGRLKKFELLDTRDFVPFGEEYEELSLENIKVACEQFYNAPQGSCDDLATDRGPSCTKTEQIKGKKVYFIRFVPPNECNSTQKRAGVCRASATSTSVPISPSKNEEISSTNASAPQTKYPKSVSIGDFLCAGKLVRPPQKKALNLEMFDVENCKWVKSSVLSVEIEKPSLIVAPSEMHFEPSVIKNHLSYQESG